jgi:cation diffusion facilitator CzcD-associated flavoprotein CzcO
VTTQPDPAAVLDVLVVGAGFSGVCLAIHLKAAGRRYCVLEQAGSLGGTWRDNVYPGAACDVPSNLYCFSFAPNPDWTRVYPPQAEIEAYLQRCAQAFGVLDAFRFGERVTGAAFDGARGLWRIDVNAGTDGIFARSLVIATGGLSRPRLPEIAGLESFAGTVFHTARWRHDIGLAGKRVGVIGTGASAVQLVPEIAPVVSRLSVFQRTPSWVLPKHDGVVSPARRARYRRWPWLQRVARFVLFCRHDLRALPFTRMRWLLKLLRPLFLLPLRVQVRDRELREKLTPRFLLGCKRVLLSNDFYPALARDNVDLVTAPIVAVTPAGVRTEDGVEHRLDVLIACTGFHAAEAGVPFPVTGRNGRDLNTIWADAATAYLGTTVPGFPNLFLMTGPNTGLGHNSVIGIIEAQTRYILAAVAALSRRPEAVLEPRVEVQRDYNRWLQARLARTVWNTGGCASWYLTRSGINTTLWPDFSAVFYRRLGRFDATDFRWSGANER